jgi:hypothetical protein
LTRTKNIKLLRISKLPFNKSEITVPKIIGFIKKATISRTKLSKSKPYDVINNLILNPFVLISFRKKAKNKNMNGMLNSKKG